MKKELAENFKTPEKILPLNKRIIQSEKRIFSY